MMLSDVCLSDVCLTSDICLSVAYIGPKSITERPRKTKIGTEVAHVKVKRSKVKVTGSGHIVAASRTDCYRQRNRTKSTPRHRPLSRTSCRDQSSTEGSFQTPAMATSENTDSRLPAIHMGVCECVCRRLH